MGWILVAGEATTTTPPSAGSGAAIVNAKRHLKRCVASLCSDRHTTLASQGSRFSFNHYSHFNLVYARDRPRKPPVVILSKDGALIGMSLLSQAPLREAHACAIELPQYLHDIPTMKPDWPNSAQYPSF